ncbi:hypothetical protein MT325_m390L [Paramecium bursaria chlorella virus MT325]|uniref:Uncharacterized protein m390L n=1 Tax=Paramecium bursaria Chlorella virus MT325 TaxID=346932 RepID=A7IUC0_PBCVM|nr:hypothetical protein MT325_m390L [Paramecium bursaria chlorella virus MT325]
MQCLFMHLWRKCIAFYFGDEFVLRQDWAPFIRGLQEADEERVVSGDHPFPSLLCRESDQYGVVGMTHREVSKAPLGISES